MNRPTSLVEVTHRNSEGKGAITGLTDAKSWGRAGPAGELLVNWSSGTSVWVKKGDLKLVPIDFQVQGVGPDAPTETLENGASQSSTPFHAISLPAKALLAVSAIHKHGDDKYGKNNWRGISVDDHLNHALVHLLAHMAGDTSEKHLEHFACRALMALELFLEQKGVV